MASGMLNPLVRHRRETRSQYKSVVAFLENLLTAFNETKKMAFRIRAGRLSRLRTPAGTQSQPANQFRSKTAGGKVRVAKPPRRHDQ